MSEIKKEVDIFRDTPVRYMGYCNEVGESFRYVAPWFVKPSYAISFGYCFADTADKGYKQYKRDGDKVSQQLAVRSADCLIWQCLASVMIPGWVIHKFVKYSKVAIASKQLIGMSPFFKKPSVIMYGPTVVGLAAIPFIIHPIDWFVD